MDEQTLYTTLLKGSMIGRLKYEGSHALVYAKHAQENALQKINFEEILIKFGHLLEEVEELELEELFISSDCKKLVEKFHEIDEKYGLYFLEELSKHRKNVEIVYQDIVTRTNIFIDDEEIKNIKTIESLKKWEDAHYILQKIVSNDEKAIIYFYKKHKDSIKHLVFSKNGDDIDAEVVMNWSLSDLKLILVKLPDTDNYFHWQPIKTDNEVKANLFTYFYKMCTYKWIDVFRKKNRYYRPLVDIEGQENYLREDDLIEDQYYEKKLRVRKAIEKLSNKCKKMYLGKWEEDFADNFNVEILAHKSGNSIGTIYNKNVDCMTELKAIIKSQTSN